MKFCEGGIRFGVSPSMNLQEGKGGMEHVATNAKVKTRARLTAVKIHGPNSPRVVSGEIPLGFKEEIPVDEPEQLVELTYDQCVEMFGQEQADALIRRNENG